MVLPIDAPKVGSRIEIDFRAGGHGQEYLIAGWSHPEPEYMWTLGKVSIVRLPLGATSGDCLLRFRSGPMVRHGTLNFQRLNVEVNGVALARLICRAPMQYELCVPAEVLCGSDAVEILFHMPDAVSPKELGGSGDSRDLGVWMSSLQFSALATVQTSVQTGGPAADKAMLMDLQSLGENCELGFVQRWAGAEPLGLFRWAYTPLSNLLSALDERFEGLGLAENLTIELDDATEFHVIDRRFGFRNHSWAYQNNGAKREDVLKREAVRLPYLARLMLENLDGAEKLFCFHDAGRSDLDQIMPLAAALGRYGPNWLLWVSKAQEGAPAGTAEICGERLIRGYVDQFQPLHNVRQPSFDAWIGAVRAAHKLWRGCLDAHE